MKAIRLLHPITHDGVHYGRGVYEEMDDETAEALLNVHSPECRAHQPAQGKRPARPAECLNHSAVPFVEQNPVKGKATPAVDAQKKAPPEAKIPEPVAPPDSSGKGKATPAVDAQVNKKAS